MNIDDIIDGLFKVIATFTELTPIGEQKQRVKEYFNSVGINCGTELKHNSIFDEACSMANTLNEIDEELIHAAQFKGDYDGSSPVERLLPNLCKLMYKSMGYHKHEKYNMENIKKSA